MVRRNNGAPGIDKITLAAVEEYGITRLLDDFVMREQKNTDETGLAGMPTRRLLSRRRALGARLPPRRRFHFISPLDLIEIGLMSAEEAKKLHTM